MSLRAKLILSFASVVVLTWVFALYLSYGKMQEHFRQDLRTNLMHLASVISYSVNGEFAKTVATAEDEQKAEWKAERDKLILIKQRLPELRYLYVYRPSSEPGHVQMVVGGEPWDAPEEDVTHAELEEYTQDEFPRMYEAFERPAADDDIAFDEEYGIWSLSGYAPVYDASGQKVAAVGLDYPANSIKEKERAMLLLLGGSSLVALILALLVSYFLARLITRPLLELVRATDHIAGGDLDAKVNIDRSDEIGALARAFNKMVTNLRNMAAALQGYASQAVESKELEVAARLQRDLVPAAPLAVPGVSAAATLRAVDFGGGTTYDYFLFGQDAYLMLSMGKASVPGLEATTLITLCKSGLSALVSNLVFRPQEIARRLNVTVAEKASPGVSVSYLCGVYDLAEGWLTLVNAGYPYPYVLRPASGLLSQLDRDSGPPLGTDAGTEYTDFDIRMEPGDCLVAYAPHVPETLNPSGESFGLARLEDALRRHAKLEPHELTRTVIEELNAFRGTDAPLEDDLAVLVVRFGV